MSWKICSLDVGRLGKGSGETATTEAEWLACGTPTQPVMNWLRRRGSGRKFYLLEEAGCTNADILNHCRRPGEHVRRCWVVDPLLGKE